MKFAVSLILIFVLWLVPIVVAQKLVRYLLGRLDRMLAKTLVDTPESADPLFHERQKRFGLIAWALVLGLFVFIAANLPKPPDYDEDPSKQAIARLYRRGVSVLGISYADGLLKDQAFDAKTVAQACSAIPVARVEERSLGVRCLLRDATSVTVNIVDTGNIVFSRVWTIP